MGRRVGGGGVRVGCLRMESRAHPAALALIDLEIFFFFATEGAFLSPFPAASFVGGCSDGMRLWGG